MPTPCSPQMQLDLLDSKPVVIAFDGGQLTSDAGLALLVQAERSIGLTKRLARCLHDSRQPGKIRFSHEELLRQRILGIAAGYEDANDHNTLRADPALKIAAGRLPLSEPDLATQPTLSRFENSIGPGELLKMAYAIVDIFIDQYRKKPPAKMVIDFDATDDPTHGDQQLSLYHGYYNTHCYVPLIGTAICDGGPHEPIMAVLRSGHSHAAHGAPSVLGRFIERVRQALPTTAIAFRGDSGFATPALYELCEQRRIHYGLGLAKNEVLERHAKPFVELAYQQFFAAGQTTQVFGEFLYRADSWPHPRRVIVKAEIIAGHHGDPNVRFVVTNDMHEDPQHVYQTYVKRGDMESRIDELKNDCFSGRTSCHSFYANQFRLLLALAAYLLFTWLRQRIDDQELRVAQVATLRTRLIKVAARVFERARHVKLSLPSQYPWIDVWLKAGLAAGGVV